MSVNRQPRNSGVSDVQVVMQGVLQSGNGTWEHEQACPMLASALNLPDKVVTCQQLSDDEFELLTAQVNIWDADILPEEESGGNVQQLPLHHDHSGLRLANPNTTVVKMKLTIQPASATSFQWSFEVVSSENLQAATQVQVGRRAGNAVITEIVAIHRNSVCGNHQCELGEMVLSSLDCHMFVMRCCACF